MNYWVVKGRSTENDWDDMLVPGTKGLWHTFRRPKAVSAHDRVFFWESAPKCCIIALGRFSKQDCGKDEKGDDLFEVEYLTGRLTSPLSITELRQLPILQDASFLKSGPAGTIFPLTKEQAASLLAVLQCGNSEVAAMWPDTKSASIALEIGILEQNGTQTCKIPNGIESRHIIAAIHDLDSGVKHGFGESTGYDVLFEGQRYAPKAVVGLAAGKLTGVPLGPYDFKGGLESKCFRVLKGNGFTIITKGETRPFPDEVDGEEQHLEGAIQRVSVNRFERNPKARAKAIKHYGSRCQACSFDFQATYGAIGSGFIHVHHIVPLAQISETYVVNPVDDLIPVCPNCHAMLHKRVPPYTIDELREILKAAS